ncbi:hypothetical protein Tco_1255283 [Tanacetum coccineum]
MPHPSQYFERAETSTEEMMREWMGRQTEANERMKDQMVELENQINQGLRNRQAIIENLERQFEYLEKIQPTESLTHTTNTKPRHEFVSKPPSVQNENDKGDVKAIKEDETETIPTMPSPNLINSNSPTVSPFLKECVVHIPYTNAKTFADNALLEDLALFDNKSWNDPRDFAKPVKAIALPQDVPITSDRCLIKLENQVQHLMEAHLAPTQPTQVNKVTTSCEICSGPHDTQYCMEDLEQAFVEYASSRTDEAGSSQDARLSKFEADFKQQQSEMTYKINTVLKAINDRIAGALPSDTIKKPKLITSPVLSGRSYPNMDP